MSDLRNKLINTETLISFLAELNSNGINPTYIEAKHQLVYENNESFQLKVRLPLQTKWLSNQTLFEDEVLPFILLIVESGQAALAYGEGNHIIEHKVIKSYMVRKKQGKSQIKYLKTKGKSKAGSRVRLANTVHFFEEIQEKINEWLAYFQLDYIALSCSKSLYTHLFTEDFELDRNDARIVKIPKHIQEASFENMLAIHRYLLQAEVIYDENDKERIIAMLLGE
ncbi:MAG: hypothetical protein ACI9L9_001738 [Marivirga sp.]|jgi:hypothetical protein